MKKFEVYKQRESELEKASIELETEAVKQKAIYKDEPKYISEARINIAEQKDICKKEKAIVEEHNAIQKSIISQEERKQKQKESVEAVNQHKKLLLEMKTKYPGCYNSKLNDLDTNKCKTGAFSEKDKTAYLNSLENVNEKREQHRDVIEKNSEGKAKQAKLREEYKNLIVPKDAPQNKKAVNEAFSPCDSKKVKEQNPEKKWIKFTLKDESSKPMSDVNLKIELPDGNIANVKSVNGEIEVKNIEPGESKMVLKLEPGMRIEDIIIKLD